MNKKLVLLAAVAAIGFAPLASADDAMEQDKSKTELKDNGGYDSTSSSEQVNPDGSKIVRDSDTDVSVDSDGKVKKTSEAETKVSNGLWHRKDEKRKTEYTQKDNGGYKQVTITRHTNTDGTNVKLVTTTDVDVDKDGNITTVAKTEKTIDPPGLMNKTTSTTVTKSVNGTVVNSDTNPN